jgi:hypothetical protein
VKERSQQDFQSPAQRGLGAGELPRQLDQLGGAPAGAAEPAPQRLPGHLAAFEVAEADDVDEGPLGRVEPERAPGPDLEFVSSQLERARVELVEARRCLQAGPSAPPGDGDVDGGGDGIGQTMARKRGLQAQRRERDPLGDLDKVESAGGASAQR